jgi:hypothetical protein
MLSPFGAAPWVLLVARRGQLMDSTAQSEYQAPMLTDIGSLQEVTLMRTKVFSRTADFTYQHHFVFNFSSQL